MLVWGMQRLRLAPPGGKPGEKLEAALRAYVERNAARLVPRELAAVCYSLGMLQVSHGAVRVCVGVCLFVCVCMFQKVG